MLSLAFTAGAADDVLLKVHVRCRSCLSETYPLVPVNRPPAGVSARAIFVRQRLCERMAFRCQGCGYEVADMVGVDYASAADVVDRSDPFPRLPPPRLARALMPEADDAGL